MPSDTRADPDRRDESLQSGDRVHPLEAEGR